MIRNESQLSPLHIIHLVIVVVTVGASISAWASGFIPGNHKAAPVAQNNDARARELFVSIIPVLKHPRCLNCHATGDFPRQGDDNHVHTQNVRRGLDGKGKYGQKCETCHQQENVAGLNMPPGAPNWHLPPANMPMIWEGKTPGEICRQIKDPKQNNGKTVAQIVEHVTADKLVLWGWNPGEGRTPPPMGHDEFARRFQEWARNGAACPEQ
jgi:hypothetical protein